MWSAYLSEDVGSFQDLRYAQAVPVGYGECMTRHDDPNTMDTLHAWAKRVGNDLGVADPVDGEVLDAVLALAGASAAEVVRPAAPVATLFAGVLYGSGRASSLVEACDMAARAMRDGLRNSE